MKLSWDAMKGKGISVFGLRGSGKTVWLKNLLSAIPKHLVVDPMLEYQGFKRYIPENRSFSPEARLELDLVAGELVVPKKGNKAKVDLFAVDECNRYAPSRHPLPSVIMDINDFQRHWDLTTVWVARRPTQLNTDLVELSNYIIIYNLAGKNDQQYLNDLSQGLGDAVLEPYYYMFVDERRHYTVMNPVPLTTKKTKGKGLTKTEVKEDNGSDNSIDGD